VTVLVVGTRLSSKERGVRGAIERASEGATFVADAAAALAAVQHGPPRCVFVDAEAGVREINEALRTRADCFGVPLIALTEHASEQAWLDLHALGADDVVQLHDLAGMTRRTSALASFDPNARTSLFQGTCLLAHDDPYRRAVLGRVLRQGGYEVAFAGSAQDALHVTEQSPPKVVVVSSRLPPDGGAHALGLLAEQWLGTMPAVLLTESGAPASEAPTRFCAIREDAPPDDLLFVINELLRPRELLESRASRRLLYGARCAFRLAGDFDSGLGLTYNISREGLYVRTFDAPPNKSRVWLELVPPGGKAACQVRGDVVWTRTLATGARGAAPPGFGVRLDFEQCAAEDRNIYLSAYDKLAASTV